MMCLYVQGGIEFQDALFGHKCFRHALMVLLEQELPIQIRNLGRIKLTSIVSKSRI